MWWEGLGESFALLRNLLFVSGLLSDDDLADLPQRLVLNLWFRNHVVKFDQAWKRGERKASASGVVSTVTVSAGEVH
jgi:hypothetical protein